MSADTGTSIAATIRATTAAARSAPRPAPSGTPRDQATPALVVAIAFAPAPAIATAEATSHAFGSSSGSPGLCRFAKAFACCACFIVMTATLASCPPSSWPDPDSDRRSAAMKDWEYRGQIGPEECRTLPYMWSHDHVLRRRHHRHLLSAGVRSEAAGAE